LMHTYFDIIDDILVSKHLLMFIKTLKLFFINIFIFIMFMVWDKFVKKPKRFFLSKEVCGMDFLAQIKRALRISKKDGWSCLRVSSQLMGMNAIK
jgi:hypothetical protein